MKSYVRASAIGRRIDLRYRSNRILVASTFVAGFVVTVWQLARGGDDPFLWGFRAGGVAFLAWAIAREIDPDDSSSATFAAQLAVLSLAAGAPSLAGAASVMLGARVMVRSSGFTPRLIDMPVLVGVAAWAAATGSWIAALAIPAALFAEAVLDRRNPRIRATAGAGGAVAMAAVFVAAALAGELDRTTASPAVAQMMVLGLGLVGAAVTLRTSPPTSLDDRGKRIIDVRRLAAARLLVLAAAAGTVAWEWAAGAGRLGPAWAAMAAVALRRPFVRS